MRLQRTQHVFVSKICRTLEFSQWYTAKVENTHDDGGYPVPSLLSGTARLLWPIRNPLHTGLRSTI